MKRGWEWRDTCGFRAFRGGRRIAYRYIYTYIAIVTDDRIGCKTPPAAAGVAVPDLAGYRRRIDAIDDRIMAVLAERFAVIREVAAYKARWGIPAVIPERVAKVRERCAAQAPARGIEPGFVRALYDLIIDEACRVEIALMSGPGAGR